MSPSQPILDLGRWALLVYRWRLARELIANASGRRCANKDIEQGLEEGTMRKRYLAAVMPIVCLILFSLSAQAQRRVYRSTNQRGTNQSVRQLILRIENRSNLFRNSVQAWSEGNTAQTYGSNEDINVLVRDFDDSVRRLHARFDQRQATATDVQDVLNHAARVDDFARRTTLDARSRNYWSSMRVDLNQLANSYNVSSPQTGGVYPPSDNPVVGQFTGTYRIDVSRSDDAQRAADQATRDLAPSDRRRIRDSLTQRLESPDQIAIDVRGQTVTLASTRAPQISFDADGRERIETAQNGRTIRSEQSRFAHGHQHQKKSVVPASMPALPSVRVHRSQSDPVLPGVESANHVCDADRWAPNRGLPDRLSGLRRRCAKHR